MTFVLAGVVWLVVPGFNAPWTSLAEAVVLAGLLLLPLRAVLHRLFAGHPFSRRVLVLGATELAGKVVQEMLKEPGLRDIVVGVVDDGSARFKPELPSVRLGSIENLGGIIEGFEPDLLVCATAERHDRVLMRELLKPRAQGIPVEDGAAAYERLTGKIAIEHAAPRAILFSNKSEVSGIALFLARTLSFAVALCGMVILFPFLLPIALLIKLDSEGPVFFLHERVGLGGRPFKLIKFRTMRTGGARSEWAADNHHRTTRVGHWLRRFRIDELPQFLNILQGDMNLVGPRPHPVSNLDLFTENIPFYGVRCWVRPGVTGWAQIRYGYANNLEEETEKMRYDLYYIKHLSLGLDLRILFETLKVVVTGGRTATLVEHPGARALPIYFGIEHPRRVTGGRRFAEARRRSLGKAGAAASVESVVSIEEHRAMGAQNASPPMSVGYESVQAESSPSLALLLARGRIAGLPPQLRDHVEYPGQHSGWNPDPGVRHADCDDLSLAPRDQPDFASGIGVLRGVGEEIR
jgi:exopolysaccharide biosynthesis polyprenyl glycosylphosphotransferase